MFFVLGDCQAKMHSTFTEAVRISQRMEAKQTIFTHFSQRYAKLPVLEEFEVEEAKNCAIGKTKGTIVYFIEGRFPSKHKRRFCI